MFYAKDREKKGILGGIKKVTQTRLHLEIQCFQSQLDIIFSSPSCSKKGKLILVQTSLSKLISSFKIEFIKNLTLFDSFNSTDYPISFVKTTEMISKTKMLIKQALYRNPVYFNLTCIKYQCDN